MFDYLLNKSAAADVRRLAHCQLSHGPNSWLGRRKRNSFLIRGAGDFARLRDPTASLVFYIRSWNIRWNEPIFMDHIQSGFAQKQIWVIVRREKLLMQFTNSLEPCFLTNYLIACCRQFIVAAPERRQHWVLVKAENRWCLGWGGEAIIPLARREETSTGTR